MSICHFSKHMLNSNSIFSFPGECDKSVVTMFKILSYFYLHEKDPLLFCQGNQFFGVFEAHAERFFAENSFASIEKHFHQLIMGWVDGPDVHNI